MALTLVGQFKFISSFGYLLQGTTGEEGSGGSVHASKPTDDVGEEERWNVFAWPDGRISLAVFRTNQFLTCEQGTGKVFANRGQAQRDETWTLVSAGDGAHVHLRSWENRYLCGQDAGDNAEDSDGEVIANRPNAGPWETWEMVTSSGDKMPNGWWDSVQQAISTAGKLTDIVVSVVAAG